MLNLEEFIYGTKSKVVIDNANDEDNGAESSDDDDFFTLKQSSRETAPITKNVIPLSSLGEEDSLRMVPSDQETLDMHAWLEEGGDSLIESLQASGIPKKEEDENEYANIYVLTIESVPVFASDSESKEDVFFFETKVT